MMGFMNGRQIADVLGVSEATISRIKAGERRPSMQLMARVRDTSKWPIEDQFAALDDGSYAQKFTERMAATGGGQTGDPA